MVVLAMTLSMHRKSYEAVSGAAQLLLQQDLFIPTRFETSRADPGDRPNDVGKPLNIVIMYADDMRHDSIGVAGTLGVSLPKLCKAIRAIGREIYLSPCICICICIVGLLFNMC